MGGLEGALEGGPEPSEGGWARGAADRRQVQARVQDQARARARSAAAQSASRRSLKAAVKKGRRQAAGGAVL